MKELATVPVLLTPTAFRKLSDLKIELKAKSHSALIELTTKYYRRNSSRCKQDKQE